MVIHLRHINGFKLFRKFLFYVPARTVRKLELIGEVASRKEAERSVLYDKTEAHAVLVQQLGIVHLGIKIAYAPITAQNLAVSRDVRTRPTIAKPEKSENEYHLTGELKLTGISYFPPHP